MDSIWANSKKVQQITGFCRRIELKLIILGLFSSPLNRFFCFQSILIYVFISIIYFIFISYFRALFHFYMFYWRSYKSAWHLLLYWTLRAWKTNPLSLLLLLKGFIFVKVPVDINFFFFKLRYPRNLRFNAYLS